MQPPSTAQKPSDSNDSEKSMYAVGANIPGMAMWRKELFAAMHLNANLPATYFGVPTSRVVEVGLEVEI